MSRLGGLQPAVELRDPRLQARRDALEALAGARLDQRTAQQHVQPPRHVALDDLDMKAIEHQAKVGKIDFADDVCGLTGAVQEIPRCGDRVQRFDQDGQIARLHAGIGQVGDKGCAGAGTTGIASHHMHGVRPCGAGIGQCRVNRGLCIGFAARKGGEAVFADGRVAARRVQAKHGQTRFAQGGCRCAGGGVVGPVTLHRVKACRLCGTNGVGQGTISP